VVGSSADIKELPIKLMTRGFRFKGGEIRMIDFLSLGIHVFALGLSSIKFPFHT